MVSFVREFEEPVGDCLVKCLPNPKVLFSDKKSKVVDLCRRFVKFFDGNDIRISESNKLLKNLI